MLHLYRFTHSLRTRGFLSFSILRGRRRHPTGPRTRYVILIVSTPPPSRPPASLNFEQTDTAPTKEDDPFHVGPFWESKIFKEGG